MLTYTIGIVLIDRLKRHSLYDFWDSMCILKYSQYLKEKKSQLFIYYFFFHSDISFQQLE